MMQRYRRLKQQRANGEIEESGFTLIELLIVIVVLGILAAIVVFALGGVTGQSVKAACNSDTKTVDTAIAAYEADNPTAGQITQAELTSGTGATLQSWPSSTAYTIVIATAAPPVTTPPTLPTATQATSVSADHDTVAENDVLVQTTSGTVTTTDDATQDPTGACNNA